MEILGQHIPPGGSAQLNMAFARLQTRTMLDVPVLVERSKEDGPCVLITGGIHGDELNGVEIARQIVAKGFNKPERGTVICIPLVNVFGFLNKSRYFPDGRDLNRMFPGSKSGSLASRFAYRVIHDIAPHVDYCIDFHTGGAERFNVTQIRVGGIDEETMELAKAFGAPFIKLAQTRDHSFREALQNLDKRCLLFEGGKSLNLDKTVTRIGIGGALRVMQHLGMRDFSQELLAFQHANVVEPIVIPKSRWIRAKHSGLFRSFTRAGKLVEKGETLGSISDPYGSFENIFKSPSDGYILSSNHAPLVNQGDALIHLGTPQ